MILSLTRTLATISLVVIQDYERGEDCQNNISDSVKWERGDVRLPLQHPNIRLGAPEAAQ